MRPYEGALGAEKAVSESIEWQSSGDRNGDEGNVRRELIEWENIVC
jgi:hypothetical protein